MTDDRTASDLLDPPLDEPDYPFPPWVRYGLLGLLAVGLAGLVWLFAAGGADDSAAVDLRDYSAVDGTLTLVEDDRLEMRTFAPLDGLREVSFTVPERYRTNFDLAHLRSHSSVGIPTRLYYERVDGAYVAVFKADAPANSR